MIKLKKFFKEMLDDPGLLMIILIPIVQSAIALGVIAIILTMQK